MFATLLLSYHYGSFLGCDMVSSLSHMVETPLDQIFEILHVQRSTMPLILSDPDLTPLHVYLNFQLLTQKSCE